MTAPREPATGVLDYLVLALVCGTAFVAGILEVMLVPLYVGSTIFPISVPLAVRDDVRVAEAGHLARPARCQRGATGAAAGSWILLGADAR